MEKEKKLLRIAEFAERVGYQPSTIRKKILRREISYHKVGRIVCIPVEEADRLLGNFHPRIYPRSQVDTRIPCGDELHHDQRSPQ